MSTNQNYTKLKDLVTGSEGSGFITIDGQNRYFFELAKNRCEHRIQRDR